MPSLLISTTFFTWRCSLFICLPQKVRFAQCCLTRRDYLPTANIPFCNISSSDLYQCCQLASCVKNTAHSVKFHSVVQTSFVCNRFTHHNIADMVRQKRDRTVKSGSSQGQPDDALATKKAKMDEGPGVVGEHESSRQEHSEEDIVGKSKESVSRLAKVEAEEKQAVQDQHMEDEGLPEKETQLEGGQKEVEAGITHPEQRTSAEGAGMNGEMAPSNVSSVDEGMADGGNALMWFRKGLRLHDNPALLRACENSAQLYCVFILDPWFLKPDASAPSPGSARVGVNRIRFLLEALQDLDDGLRKRGSRLLLLHGNPVEVLPTLFRQWKIGKLCYEYDSEPYAQQRDLAVKKLAEEAGIQLVAPVSHTLCDPQHIIAKNKGQTPLSYQSFLKLMPKVPPPVDDPPAQLPRAPDDLAGVHVSAVPGITELGYDEGALEDRTPFEGGETHALARLERFMAREQWVCAFEKPKGDPAAFDEPATTVLSPYLKFGCLSSRLLYQRLMRVYGAARGGHSKPPVSLEGQLLWREFFYTSGYGTPGFDRMLDNHACKQIAWKEDEHLLAAWRDARTGFPWIDAIMTQLRKWGWMHHLARHSVACFLTRGDLYVHWEKGRDVFDRLLIDGDWAINNGNWMWLSASCFFAQYHRIYSPITFGKKYDPAGKYIRHFLPVLKDMPAQYIYEPWTAPLAVQKKAKCIIGTDYPSPIVEHAEASKACRERMARSYALNKSHRPSLEELDAIRDDPEQPASKVTPKVATPDKGKRKGGGSKVGSRAKGQKKITDF